MKIDIKFDGKPGYGVYINELKELKFGAKVAIVTNAKVGGLYLQNLLSRIVCPQKFVISVPDGEEYKNMQTIEAILEQLFVSRLDRSSVIIALGGGVVSDMAGFAASIFERGIKFINIPTTLLAQVDASVGGKTGVNNKFGKNLIGSFYQPSAVYCETEFLKTLEKREFAAGLAEAAKMAVTFDEKLFSWMEDADLTDEANLQNLIYRCVQIKAAAVEADEREKGVRAVLNYGHTFAHVIENETNYKKYLHGEAVAIGMNMANALAVKLGLMSEEQKACAADLLVKFGLPISYKVPNASSFYEAFFLDKKAENSAIKFILPRGIGAYEIRKDVPRELVMDVLREFE